MKRGLIQARGVCNALNLGVFLCICALSLPALAAPLSEEISHLLETHPQIKSAKLGVTAAGQSIRESRSPFYPTVALTGDTGFETVDSPATRARGGSGVTEGRRDKTGLEINLNLFDGFRKYANLSRSRFEKAAAEYNLEATRQLVTFQGISAYVDVLRQRRLLELAQLSENTIQRQLRLEDERVRRGSGLTVDVLQSKSRLQIAKELRVSVVGALRNAESRYFQIFGRAPRLVEMKAPEPPLASLPKSVEDAVKMGRGENPQLESSSRQIDIADQNRRAAQSDYYPQVDLVVEGNRENNLGGIIGVRKEIAVLVRARWELFSGFARQARVARASAQRSASVSNYAFLERQVVDSVRIAWNSLETARERKALLENAINIASEVFDARKRLRAAGKETVINVLDAENEVNNARIQFTSAFYDMLVAGYQVHFAVGTLTPRTLGISQ